MPEKDVPEGYAAVSWDSKDYLITGGLQGCIQPVYLQYSHKIRQHMHFFHIAASTIHNLTVHFHVKYDYWHSNNPTESHTFARLVHPTDTLLKILYASLGLYTGPQDMTLGCDDNYYY